MLISVVDDDESVRESLPDLLRELGFEVEAFASAEELRLHPMRTSRSPQPARSSRRRRSTPLSFPIRAAFSSSTAQSSARTSARTFRRPKRV